MPWRRWGSGGVLGTLKLQSVAQPADADAGGGGKPVGDGVPPLLPPRHELGVATAGGVDGVRALDGEAGFDQACQSVVVRGQRRFARRHLRRQVVVEGARPEPDNGPDAVDVGVDN